MSKKEVTFIQDAINEWTVLRGQSVIGTITETKDGYWVELNGTSGMAAPGVSLSEIQADIIRRS